MSDLLKLMHDAYRRADEDDSQPDWVSPVTKEQKESMRTWWSEEQEQDA